MSDHRCRYCQQVFRPCRYHPHQLVCGRPDCQRQRRRDYRRRKVHTDAEYHQVCGIVNSNGEAEIPIIPGNTGSPTLNPWIAIGKTSAGETATRFFTAQK